MYYRERAFFDYAAVEKLRKRRDVRYVPKLEIRVESVVDVQIQMLRHASYGLDAGFGFRVCQSGQRLRIDVLEIYRDQPVFYGRKLPGWAVSSLRGRRYEIVRRTYVSLVVDLLADQTAERISYKHSIA